MPHLHFSQRLISRAFYICLRIINKCSRINVKNLGLPLVTFGSKYGGWTSLELSKQRNLLLISAGVGEDISFDIEFLNFYPKSRAILIDPTERSKMHIKSVNSAFGSSKTEHYTNSGHQSIQSYDLRYLTKDRLKYLDSALTENNLGVFLEKPNNPSHVSYSKANRDSTNLEWFKSTNLSSVLSAEEAYGNEFAFDCWVLKLDIEGYEIEVLRHLLADEARPCQLLVEFDILRCGKFTDFLSFIRMLLHLSIEEYMPVHQSGLNVTFYGGHCG